jgi:hypothetical protein
MKHGVEQKLFKDNTLIQHSSLRKYREKLHWKYPNNTVLCEATTHTTVTKIHSMGLMLDKKKS